MRLPIADKSRNRKLHYKDRGDISRTLQNPKYQEINNFQYQSKDHPSPEKFLYPPYIMLYIVKDQRHSRYHRDNVNGDHKPLIIVNITYVKFFPILGSIGFVIFLLPGLAICFDFVIFLLTGLIICFSCIYIYFIDFAISCCRISLKSSRIIRPRSQQHYRHEISASYGIVIISPHMPKQIY